MFAILCSFLLEFVDSSLKFSSFSIEFASVPFNTVIVLLASSVQAQYLKIISIDNGSSITIKSPCHATADVYAVCQSYFCTIDLFHSSLFTTRTFFKLDAINRTYSRRGIMVYRYPVTTEKLTCLFCFS